MAYTASSSIRIFWREAGAAETIKKHGFAIKPCFFSRESVYFGEVTIW